MARQSKPAPGAPSAAARSDVPPAVTGADAILTAAVAEAARLLDADGAMVYLADPETGRLRFAHDAGISDGRSRRWVRRIQLEPGTGMFGRAVADRAVLVTGDYANDPSFTHAADPDRVVADIGIRSMVVAPLLAGDDVFGAIGAFTSRPDAFQPQHVALVRALADHAAAAMANASLIEALDTSRAELAAKADAERTLREITARLSAAADMHAVLQLAVDEAARLLAGEGARIDLLDATTNRLDQAYASGGFDPEVDEDLWPDDPDESIDQGVSGQAIVTGRPFWTGDYVGDGRFIHARGADVFIANVGIHSVISAPLMSESGARGVITVFSTRPDAWGETDAALLATIADQAAIAMSRATLVDELDRSRLALARRANAEQALREIAARITSLRDPAEILQEVVELASRLVGGQGAILDLLDPATGYLRWAFDDGLSAHFNEEERGSLWIAVGVGATGTAVAEDRIVIAGSDLASQFPPSPESTEFYERTGFQSMIVVPIRGDDGPLGVLEVYSVRPDAFTEADADLMRALASQAAIAITNARLIAELAESRTALKRTADAERALREIAAQVSAMRDQDEILQAVVDAATRVLGADGSMIDIAGTDETAGLWTYRQTDEVMADPRLFDPENPQVHAGVAGKAVAERRVVLTGDYLHDDRFAHSEDRDAFVRDAGVRSVLAAPLLQRGDVLGVVTVYAGATDAFGEADGALLLGLADQAAAAIANVRLIDALERARQANAKRADAERTLREIAARVSAILDPADVLDRIVNEAARLLDSDGARIDIWDDDLGALRWAYAAGDSMREIPEWGRTQGLRPRQAVAGLAFAVQAPVMTEDFLVDPRFETTPEIEAFVRTAGIRAVISTPLFGDKGPLGVLSVVSREPGGYSDADVEVLTALATHASIAITNANLMEQLARSRSDIERRAEAERTLREIAARITAIRQQGDLLQRIADEALRLLRADGAVIHEFDPERQMLVAIHDAGITEKERAAVRASQMPFGRGVAGKAVAERRVVSTGDYLAGDFDHQPTADALAIETGIGSLIVAPVIGEDGPLGAIEVYRHDKHAFDAIDEATLGALGEQAAIAITNANLIAALERSKIDLAARAETERTLRDITARIAALHDPDELLPRVVEDARRLIGTDGAHLTRMAEAGDHLVPVVLAGDVDDATRAWLLTLEFPLGEGINGLAAQEGRPIWTRDYLEDDRIPLEPEDVAVVERLGVRGMAAAPLRAPGGEVIGTLAVSTRGPRTFDDEGLDLLQGLADQAAIAMTNSSLLARLSHEEARFRGLVQTTPDVIWRADTEGRFTFFADSGEAMFGHRVQDMVGQHFAMLTDPDYIPIAAEHYIAASKDPDLVQNVHLVLIRRDGSEFAADISVVGVFEDGKWVGNQGTVRDVSERDRLEAELRRSEERYRFLIENSPDIIFAMDTEGRFTYVSESVRRALGVEPSDLIGAPFTTVIHYDNDQERGRLFALMRDDPDLELTSRMTLKHVDGRRIPFEVSSVGVRINGEFGGIHGAARDIGERDRLESELRRQAGELASGEERAHLARELHDSVTQALFSMTLVSRSVEMLLDRDPEAARTQLAQLRDLQRDALAEMRALIFELRPGNLEQDGLVRALKTHTSALQGRLGLPVVVESDLTDRLPLPAEEALYRIAQEALHNVVKHAAAREVRVALTSRDGGVRLRVTDDGKGFDPDTIPDGHLGLAGMRARAERIGGTFSCTSEAGKGTAVQIDLDAAVLEEVRARSAARALAEGGDVPASTEPVSIRDG